MTGSAGLRLDLSSVLFGDPAFPNIAQDYVFLLGYSIFDQEHNLTRFNLSTTNKEK